MTEPGTPESITSSETVDEKTKNFLQRKISPLGKYALTAVMHPATAIISFNFLNFQFPGFENPTTSGLVAGLTSAIIANAMYLHLPTPNEGQK